MLLALLKVAIALAQPGHSDAWIDERAHATCYAMVDADAVCSEAVDDYLTDDAAHEDYAHDDSET